MCLIDYLINWLLNLLKIQLIIWLLNLLKIQLIDPLINLPIWEPSHMEFWFKVTRESAELPSPGEAGVSSNQLEIDY